MWAHIKLTYSVVVAFFCTFFLFAINWNMDAFVVEANLFDPEQKTVKQVWNNSTVSFFLFFLHARVHTWFRWAPCRCSWFCRSPRAACTQCRGRCSRPVSRWWTRLLPRRTKIHTSDPCRETGIKRLVLLPGPGLKNHRDVRRRAGDEAELVPPTVGTFLSSFVQVETEIMSNFGPCRKKGTASLVLLLLGNVSFLNSLKLKHDTTGEYLLDIKNEDILDIILDMLDRRGHVGQMDGQTGTCWTHRLQTVSSNAAVGSGSVRRGRIQAPGWSRALRSSGSRPLDTAVILRCSTQAGRRLRRTSCTSCPTLWSVGFRAERPDSGSGL